MVCLLVCLMLLVGCGNNESVSSGNNINESNIQENVEITDSEEESISEIVEEETEEVVSGELVFCETISMSSEISLDEEKVAAAIALGFPDPATELDVYDYISKEEDVIQYTPVENEFGLESNFEHQGFGDIKVVYEKKEYMWDDFFGDLDATEFIKTTTVKLKGNNIYEEEIEDEYAKYYRYYDESKGIYYEVQDLMMGSYVDDEEELVNEKFGQTCNYGAFDMLVPPTHNPLVLRSEEEFLGFYITEYDDTVCLYYETLYSDSLYKRWVSLEDGIVVKELVFSSEGLLESEKNAISISYDELDPLVFSEPRDVEYTDITMFIYAFEGGDLETLAFAMADALPETETGIVLTSEDGKIVTLYAAEVIDGMIDEVVYYDEYVLESGETRSVRTVQDDRIYTICDELEIVEIYDRSSRERFFFDFEQLGLLGVTTEGTKTTYSFYNPNNISVSGLYDVYEYVIEDGVLSNVVTYRIESIENREVIGVVSTYNISLIDFDASMYDESCMDSYEIIDHGEGSIDDGEHVPVWYQ